MLEVFIFVDVVFFPWFARAGSAGDNCFKHAPNIPIAKQEVKKIFAISKKLIDALSLWIWYADCSVFLLQVADSKCWNQSIIAGCLSYVNNRIVLQARIGRWSWRWVIYLKEYQQESISSSRRCSHCKSCAICNIILSNCLIEQK